MILEKALEARKYHDIKNGYQVIVLIASLSFLRLRACPLWMILMKAIKSSIQAPSII